MKLMEVTLQTGPLQKAEQFLNILLNLEKDIKTPGITCMLVILWLFIIENHLILRAQIEGEVWFSM